MFCSERNLVIHAAPPRLYRRVGVWLRQCRQRLPRSRRAGRVTGRRLAFPEGLPADDLEPGAWDFAIVEMGLVPGLQEDYWRLAGMGLVIVRPGVEEFADCTGAAPGVGLKREQLVGG